MEKKVNIIHTDGTISMAGDIDNKYDYHSIALVDLGMDLYPKDKSFDKRYYLTKPETISYIYVKNHGDVVFLNTSKSHDSKYTATIVLPDEITDEQIDTLNKVSSKFSDYDFIILYNLYQNEDMVIDGKQVLSKGNNLLNTIESSMIKKDDLKRKK